MRLHTVVGAAIVLAALPAFLPGQAVGTIQGTATDSSGAVVPRVQITAVNSETGLKRSTISNEVGNYTIPALRPGIYSVEAELEGFRKQIVKDIELKVDQTARINLVLETGSLTQTVEVTGEALLVNTEAPALGHVIENKRVLNLPLNGRQFLELTLQVPGVVTGNGGPQDGNSTMFSRPGQNSSISVSGGRSQNNSFLLDGTQNTDPDVNAYVVSPSVDSVQEFKMETHNYSAEFGRSSGGQINVVTRSGSNVFHGSAYEFLRNSAIDARPFNNPRALPAFRRNQFGATLGGPVIKNRTFFFAAYEGFRRVEGQSNTQSVPTIGQRAGDFSGGPGIFDPASTQPDPADPTGKRLIRTQFPGNVIPANRLNSIATRLLGGFVPVPNMPGAANNYIDTRSARQRNNQESLRIDHRFSASDVFFGRHTISNESSFSPIGLPGSGTYSRVRAQNLTLSETHIFGPALVNELKFGYLRLRLERLSENAYKRDVVGELGIPGVQFGGPQVWGVPSVTITGVATIGDDNFFLPMRLRNNTFQVTEGLSWTRGKHNVKFGAEVRRPQFNIIQIFTPRGDFRFSNGFTTQTAGTGAGDRTGSALASFMLGLPYQQRRTLGVNPSYLRQLIYGGFVQDDWKVSARLTLNLGLRYDFSSPWVDKYDRLSNISFKNIPSINTIASQNLLGKYSVPIVLAGQDGTPRGLTTSDRNNFAPRFGFAWRPTGKNSLVVRGGYGLYYGATDGEHVGRVSLNLPFVIGDTQDSDSFIPMINGIGFTTPPAIGGALRQSFIGMYENLRTPYTHQWNLAIQYEPFRDTAFEIAYVGSASHKLDYRDAMNDGSPGPGSLDAKRLFQTMALPTDLPAGLPGPVANYSIPASTLEIQTNRVNANYEGLQLKVERRFAKGFTFLSTYTFSKTIADGNSYRRQGTQGELAQDFLHNRERGLTGYDVRNRFVTSFVYEFPFGKGRRFSPGSTMLDHIAGGWQVSGIFQAQSGFPTSVLMPGSTANNGRYTYPDVVYGQKPALDRSQRTLTHYFNTGAYTSPAPFAMGNSGVMNLIGPGLHSLDVGLAKSLRLAERHSLQIRAEFFNFYNHPSWGPVYPVVGTAAYNTISSQSVPPRQLQFGLKYLF